MEEKTVRLSDYAMTCWANKINSLYDIAQDVYNQLCKSEPEFEFDDDDRIIMTLKTSYNSEHVFADVIKHLLMEMISSDYNELNPGKISMDFFVYGGKVIVKLIASAEDLERINKNNN